MCNFFYRISQNCRKHSTKQSPHLPSLRFNVIVDKCNDCSNSYVNVHVCISNYKKNIGIGEGRLIIIMDIYRVVPKIFLFVGKLKIESNELKGAALHSLKQFGSVQFTLYTVL